MKISIIIPTYNRTSYLKRCLESILIQNHPIVGEIFIVINGKDRATQHLLEEQYANNDQINFYSIDKSTPAEARNTAVKKSKFEYLFFMDDDTRIPDHFFEKLNHFLQNNQVCVLGGPDKSPKDSSYLQYSFGLALESPFCSGHTFKRHSISHKLIHPAKEEHLTLANLIVKRSIMIDHQIFFKDRYFRNEENDLIQEIQKHTSKIYQSPDLFVYHYRRENIIWSLKGSFYSGHYRAKMLWDKGATDQKLFFILPLILLITQIALIIYPTVYTLYTVLLYALIALIPTIIITIRNRAILSLPIIWMLHYFIPTVYSLGIFKTLIDLKFRRIS